MEILIGILSGLVVGFVLAIFVANKNPKIILSARAIVKAYDKVKDIK